MINYIYVYIYIVYTNKYILKCYINYIIILIASFNIHNIYISIYLHYSVLYIYQRFSKGKILHLCIFV